MSRSLPPARSVPTLGERGAVAMATAAAVGAWWSAPLPLWPGGALLLVAFAARRPWLLIPAAGLLAAALGARAHAGLDPPAPAPFEGSVTLVADPEPTPFGVHVDVREGGRRLELSASGGAAGAIGHGLAGERFLVEGRIGPPRPGSPWLVPRHVAGRLQVERAERLDGGAWPWRMANRVRRILTRSADGMPETVRSLYAGFVLGDDRNQAVDIVDDFRGAGLTHLLVVSGQNVAFVLVLAAPMIRRLGLAGRWALTVAVIAAFATVTRFEPSVLRASVMAIVAASASLAGRPATTMRVLSLTITGLLLVDPLLVLAVGFQLSVAATAGIALLSSRIATALPGPVALRQALGVTLGAQLGVSPVLVPRFGGMPVAAIPANLLAVPVAGLVTTWGLPAGFIGGLVGGRAAGVLHLPTRLMITWVAGVARVAASVPMGELGPVALVVMAGAGLLGTRSWAGRGVRSATAVVLGACLVLPAVRLARPPFDQQVAGAELYRHGGATVLVLDGAEDPADLLQGLRHVGVRRLDLIITSGTASPAVLGALRHRWRTGTVVDRRAGPTRRRIGDLLVTTDARGLVDVGEAPDG